MIHASDTRIAAQIIEAKRRQCFDYAHPYEREWYVRATLQHGWSRDVLVHQIESGPNQRWGGDYKL